MLVEYLKSFGLTGYEAQVYMALVQSGAQTGYELANATRLPRASVYPALASLLDKGGALKVGEEPTRYVAVPPSEFTSNMIRSLQYAAEVVVDELRFQVQPPDTIAILEGEDAVANKVINMIGQADHTIYISAASGDLAHLATSLTEASTRGAKVVVLAEGRFQAVGMIIYANESPATWLSGAGRPIRLIVDSSLILTGELGRQEASRAICSRNASLVSMAKHSFVQEIILAEARRRFEAEFVSCFGADFSLIRQKITSHNPSKMPGTEK